MKPGIKAIIGALVFGLCFTPFILATSHMGTSYSQAGKRHQQIIEQEINALQGTLVSTEVVRAGGISISSSSKNANIDMRVGNTLYKVKYIVDGVEKTSYFRGTNVGDYDEKRDAGGINKLREEWFFEE